MSPALNYIVFDVGAYTLIQHDNYIALVRDQMKPATE